MAWSKIGTDVGVAIAAGTGTQSITLPGPPAIGDLVLVAIAGDVSCANSIASSGYTVPDNGTGVNPGANFGYKVLTTIETVVLINKNATILKSCVVQVWRGGNAASILDQAYPTVATGSSANPNSPSIVTQNANALVVSIAFLDDDDSTVSIWPQTPGVFTNGKSANTGQGSSTVGSTVALSSLVVASPGTVDPGAYTMSSSDQWQAGTISFREAVEEYSGAASIGGNGSIAGVIQKNGKGSALKSAGGTLLALGVAAMLGIASIFGGGAALSEGRKGSQQASSISGGGLLTVEGIAGVEEYSGIAIISGNGLLSSEVRKNAQGSLLISGNGSVSSEVKKNAQNSPLISGNGFLQSIVQKGVMDSASISCGGSLVVTGQGSEAEAYFGTALISGSGSLLSEGRRGGQSSILISDNGSLTTDGRKSSFITASISQNGLLESIVLKAGLGTVSVIGDGVLTGIGKKQISVASVIVDGGFIVVAGRTNHLSVAIISGNGILTVLAQSESEGSWQVSGDVVFPISSQSMYSQEWAFETGVQVSLLPQFIYEQVGWMPWSGVGSKTFAEIANNGRTEVIIKKSVGG